MVVSSEGCNCGKASLTRTPGVCSKDTVCGTNDEYRKGECLKARCDNTKTPNANADCCPGQVCQFDGSCVDAAAACTSDTDCTNAPGQTCQSRPDIETDKQICSFPIPGTDGTCPDGYTAFNKRCIVDLPCGGACADTQVCNIELGACEALPDIPTTDSACEQTCATGSIKVYADPDSMVYHQCCALTCACDVLPPLRVGQFGTNASAALASNEIVVASYDVTYGDLVVSHYAKADGGQTSLEFVDGVPASGTLGGDPKGYRNGISDAGPNVGEFSSVVVGADGHIRVTYYDIDNSDLKYAEKTDSGWVVHTIDSVGAVGKYSFLEIMNGGSRLRVTYLVESAPRVGQAAGDNTQYTGLRYIESNSQSPASAADWSTRVDIDSQPVLPVPCGGTCATGEICVVVTGAQKCATKATTCPTPAPTSPAGQVCAKPDGSTTAGYYVEHAIPVTQEFPQAVGLFSSMVETGSSLFISYYDYYTDKGADPSAPQIGRLRGAMLTTVPATGSIDLSKTPVTVTLDAGTICTKSTSDDVGRFTSIGVNQTGTLGVAYMDATAKALRYYAIPATNNYQDFRDADPLQDCMVDGAELNNQSVDKFITIADDGIDATTFSVDYVGADASLIYDASGKAQIAYQDSRALSLKLATESAENSENFKPATISDAQAKSVGFFPQLLTDGTHSWVMHVHVGTNPNDVRNDAIFVVPMTLP